MNSERVGKDVALVEEAEISSIPSSESLNEKDDSIDELMRPFVQVTGFMIFLIKRKK